MFPTNRPIDYGFLVGGMLRHRLTAEVLRLTLRAAISASSGANGLGDWLPTDPVSVEAMTGQLRGTVGPPSQHGEESVNLQNN